MDLNPRQHVKKPYKCHVHYRIVFNIDQQTQPDGFVGQLMASAGGLSVGEGECQGRVSTHQQWHRQQDSLWFVLGREKVRICTPRDPFSFNIL